MENIQFKWWWRNWRHRMSPSAFCIASNCRISIRSMLHIVASYPFSNLLVRKLEMTSESSQGFYCHVLRFWMLFRNNMIVRGLWKIQFDACISHFPCFQLDSNGMDKGMNDETLKVPFTCLRWPRYFTLRKFLGGVFNHSFHFREHQLFKAH